MNFQVDRPNHIQGNISRTWGSKSKMIFLLTIWNRLYHCPLLTEIMQVAFLTRKAASIPIPKQCQQNTGFSISFSHKTHSYSNMGRTPLKGKRSLDNANSQWRYSFRDLSFKPTLLFLYLHTRPTSKLSLSLIKMLLKLCLLFERVLHWFNFC